MRRYLLTIALLLVLGLPAQAAEVHAIAMHGTPKYAADFAHLDYVNPDAPKGGTLRLAKTGSFDNLNIVTITGTAAEGLDQIYDKLMQRVWDEPFTLYGLIAERVELSDDRSVATFHINPAARFHDGAPVTSEDILFSFNAFKTHGHPVRRRVYGLVEKAEIIDEKTIRFTFGEGYDRESVMILALMHVLPRHGWEGRDISKTTLRPPLGSGPYKIARVDPGREIVYTRVADYWAKDLPVMRGQYNFDTIRYTYFRDDDVSVQSLKGGAYDMRREFDITKWMSDYPDEELARRQLVKEEIKHQRPEWLRAIVFNTRRPMFADIRTRQALSCLINYEWINKNLYHGRQQVIDSIFPNSELAAQGAARFKPCLGDTRTRQKQAMALLKSAGWRFRDQKLVDAQNRQMSIEILLSGTADSRIAIEFTRALSRAGIAASVRNVDAAQFTGRLDAFDYDMVIHRWINSLSPGNEQLNYWGSAAAGINGSRNYAGIKDDRIDKLADSIARTTDRQSLVEAARALDQAVMAGYYMIPLFYSGNDLVVRQSDIRRPETTPVYGMVLETWWRDSSSKAAD